MHTKYSWATAIFTDISRLHEDFSREFLEIMEDKAWNLRKQQVGDVIEGLEAVEPCFMQHLQRYDMMVRHIRYDRLKNAHKYEQWELRSRVKQIDSSVNKLLFYRYGKKEEGKVSINKCLNDLNGFRIIIDGFDYRCKEFDTICKDFEKSHCKIKKETRFLGNNKYKATHVYFFGDNRYFPWELQIWSTKDEQQNEISHKQHKSKRKYINWPQTHRDYTE